jgi:DNA-binding CsgD family transcriptional regulator
MTFPVPSPKSVPRWVRAHGKQVMGARGDASRLKRVISRSSVPMVLVDRERQYADGNGPARLALRLSHEELRRLRIDDLTPSHFLPVLDEAWRRLLETGCVVGSYEIAYPAEAHLAITYYAVANVLPGLYLVAFVPAQWPDGELVDGAEHEPAPPAPLSARELQVLALAADGHDGPAIAQELVVSRATVRTHFAHIYAKLDVSDRAAAVARAIRLGLIA